MNFVFKFIFLGFLLSSVFAQTTEIDILINELNFLKEDTSKANLYNKIANKLESLASFQSAINYADLALNLSEKFGYHKGIISAYNNIATINLRIGNLVKSSEIQHKALEMAKANNFKKEISFSLNNIGTVARMMGDYEKALSVHYEALTIANEIYDLSLLAAIYGNIGSVFYFLNDFDETIKFYSLAIDISKELNDKRKIMILMINIGNVHLIKGELDLGLEYYLEAVELNKQVDNKSFLADNYNNIGLIYEAKGEYENAVEMFLKSLLIKQELQDKVGVTNAYKNLGLTNMRLNNYNEAREFMHKGLEIAAETGSKYQIAGLYKDLLSLDTITGNYKSALHYYTKYSLYMDSMHNKTNNEKISELKVQYESAQKDNEIKIQKIALDKTNVEIYSQRLLNRNQHQQIELLNKDRLVQKLDLELKEEELLRKKLELEDEKNKLEIVVLENEIKQNEIERQKLTRKIFTYAFSGIFLFVLTIGVFVFQRRAQNYNNKLVSLELNALKAQMNPHFIFNALNSISNLIHKNEKDKATDFLVKFSKLIRSILNSSLTEYVSLSDEINTLTRYTDIERESLKEKFTYSIKIAPEIDTENTLIGSLLLQPFVENSIWHGIAPKDGTGHIDIQISKKDNFLFCSIEDNGVGRKQSNSKKEKSILSNESLGVKLTKKRIELLSKNKCTLNFIDIQNGGLRVELSIPYKEMF